jgi:hypothetical protein
MMIEDHLTQDLTYLYAFVTSMGAGNHIRADGRIFVTETVCKFIRCTGFDAPNKNRFIQIQNDTLFYRVYCIYVQFCTNRTIQYYRIVILMSHCKSRNLLMNFKLGFP